MPVDIQQFKQAATKTLGERITEWVASQPSQAFSLYDIIGGVEGHATALDTITQLVGEMGGGGSPTMSRYREALDQLVAEKVLASADLKGQTHYALAAALEPR